MTWRLWEIINVIRNQNWQRQWGNNEATATSSWWRGRKGREGKEEVKGEGECEGKKQQNWNCNWNAAQTTLNVNLSTWNENWMQSFAPRCWRWRWRRTLAERSWRAAAAGSAWRSQSQFWIQFLLHFRCFHWTVVNVVEDRGSGTISRQGGCRGVGGVWKSSQVNAVIVGAANMALPQSATAEAATATESALDNEKLKQEAEVQAERAGRGRGRGSWHESFRNVKMLCTLEVTVSGRGRVGEQGEMQLSDLCAWVCVCA